MYVNVTMAIADMGGVESTFKNGVGGLSNGGASSSARPHVEGRHMTKQPNWRVHRLFTDHELG